MLSSIIRKSIDKVVGISDFSLQAPENENFGDYSSNVALQIKAEGKNPRQIAEELKEKLEKDEELAKLIEKIEIAGPGFLNFWLNKETLLDALVTINSSIDTFPKSNFLKGKRINLEFGQPNTHKLPHIGHLFSYIFGESLARILESNGAEVYRVNYQGDVGLHVAKCLWAFEKEKPVVPDELESKVKLLQEMYQKGSAAYEGDETAQKEIQELNKKIYEKHASIKKLWEETRGWSVEYYKKFESRLGIKYDRYYFESEVYEEGTKIVKKNLGKTFKKSEGAIIFEGSKHGLHDRVFITQYDTPTYEAKDLYLEVLKYKEWAYDLLIITTASEQNEYFKVVYKALETLNTDLKGKLKHIGFGMVNLKTGKMSSRTGNIISAVDLVDMVIDRVSHLGTGDKKISDKVGMGAIKYSFLKNNPLQDTTFSIEESIASEGNSGPYLQYTVARTNSVLSKSSKKANEKSVNDLKPEELKVLRTLPQYSEVIAGAAKSYSPNLLANYLYGLAQKYNAFYNKHKIIGGEHEAFRVELTKATGALLKNGLKVLGIETPERM